MKKKLVTAAVGISLSVVGAHANAWQDPGYAVALIPYVVKDGNRTTLVSIIMGDEVSLPGVGLRLQYWSKPITSAHTEACQPNSFAPIQVTQNDMLTFDTAGILGYPLFGDVTNPAPLGTSIVYSDPRHGYLMVEAPNSDGSGKQSIVGSYWTEIDFVNGGSIGDRGLNAYSANLQVTASGHRELLPDASGSIVFAAPVVFWPLSYMDTSFTVTPLGTDMLTRENNQTTVQVYNSNSVQGLYDRNESGIDGTVPQTVRCVGRLTTAQLMPGVVANAAWAATGGWGYLTNRGDGNATPGERQTNTAQGDLPAVVYQIDQLLRQRGKPRGFTSNATPIVTQH